jgi:hypothetical protein
MQRLGLVVAVLGLFIGCGPGGPELGRVTGKVTLDGKPVPNAMITYYPQFAGSTSYGVTDQDGNYKMKYTDSDEGAMVGKFHVGIQTKRMTREDMPDGMKPEEFNKLASSFVELPKKYKNKEAIEVEVKRGSNTIDLTLESK